MEKYINFEAIFYIRKSISEISEALRYPTWSQCCVAGPGLSILMASRLQKGRCHISESLWSSGSRSSDALPRLEQWRRKMDYFQTQLICAGWVLCNPNCAIVKGSKGYKSYCWLYNSILHFYWEVIIIMEFLKSFTNHRASLIFILVNI